MKKTTESDTPTFGPRTAWERAVFAWCWVEARLEVAVERLRRALTGEQCTCGDEPQEDCRIHGLGDGMKNDTKSVPYTFARRIADVALGRHDHAQVVREVEIIVRQCRDEAHAEGHRMGLREAHDLCRDRARAIAEASMTTVDEEVRAQQAAHASEAWACCNAVYAKLVQLDVTEEPE